MDSRDIRKFRVRRGISNAAAGRIFTLIYRGRFACVHSNIARDNSARMPE
jgi:hypothetical protein